MTAGEGRDLAENADYDWIDTVPEDVRRRLVALHTRTAALLEAARPGQARALYDAACRLDPLSDQLARHANATFRTNRLPSAPSTGGP